MMGGGRCLLLLWMLTVSVCLAGCRSAPPPPGPGAPGSGPATRQAGEALAGRRVLMVVAPRDFRDVELVQPRDALALAGATVEIASTQRGTVTGADGLQVEATVTASEADATAYEAVVFIGGPGMAPRVTDPALVGLARRATKAGKLVGAICVAPGILAEAGLLNGVEATAFESELERLRKGGARLAAAPVVTSGRIVTANGPGAADAFGKALVGALSQ
jgi:protease I